MKLAFIGGTGRCGTSIIRQLLGSSERVSVLPFEHRILIDPDGPIDFLENMGAYRDPYKTDLAIRRMVRHLEQLDNSSILRTSLDMLIKNIGLLNKKFTPSKYSGWNLSSSFSNYQDELAKFKSSITTFTYKARWVGSESYCFNNKMIYLSSADRKEFIVALNNFYSSLVSNYLDTRFNDYFIEDSTWNMTYIKSLSEIFPQAKFIHVFRDPRDVIASFIKQTWMPNEIENVVRIYQDLMSDILVKTAASPSCYHLRFENLIENKDAELSQLCDYLEIEYVENMEQFKLGSGNIGRYKLDFDKDAINYLNNTLSPHIEALGYAK